MVACGHAPEVFDPIEEAFDAIALSIEHRAEASLPSAVRLERDVGRSASLLDRAAQPVGVIGLVGKDDGTWPEMSQQLRGRRAIRRLTRCEEQLERQAARVDDGVNLGGQSAARAAHTAIRVAFFEFAAC